MQFVHPYILWGLFAGAIPVIIHLFRLRRFKTVLFSDTRLLREVKFETRKKSKIKHLILLLLRVLTIFALVIAFARPYIPRSDALSGAETSKTVIVYVDNSFSMEAGESYHSCFSIAKNKTIEIANAFTSTDRFILLSNRQDAGTFRPLTKKQFTDKISDLETSSFVTDFSGVLLKFSEIKKMMPGGSYVGFIISDFQNNFFTQEQAGDTVEFPVFLVAVEPTYISNAGIDTVWLDSPVLQAGKQISVHAKIVNYSNEHYENIPVELYVNNNRRSVSSCDLLPKGTATVEMSFVAAEYGNYECYVQIHDGSITYDNKMYFSFSISETINVLAISEKKELNKSISAIYRNEPLFSFTHVNINQLKSEQISEAELLIIDAVSSLSSGLIQEIDAYVREGGTIIIIPSSVENAGNINELFRRLGVNTYGNINNVNIRISHLALEHEIFNGVFDAVPKNMDLPVVRKYFFMNKTGTGWSLPLLKMQNMEPFLFVSAVDGGNIYCFTSPLEHEFTDFYRHPLMVPVFFQISFLSRKQPSIYYNLCRNEPITFIHSKTEELKGNEIKIISKDRTLSIIPQIMKDGNRLNLFLNNMIETAENYNIFFNNEVVQSVGMNYSRDESYMNFYSKAQLDSIFAKHKNVNADILSADKMLTNEIHQLVHLKQLWKIFLFLALLFLGIEIILLRFWK